MRAELLQIVGYDAQIIEFIDMEHTPKNLLIRALKKSGKQESDTHKTNYEIMRDFLSIHPFLEKLIT